MSLQTHGDQKYQSSTLMDHGAAEFNALRIEHRRIDAGPQSCVRPECNELVYILSGQAVVRRKADGQMQEGIARRGTSWLVPAGTNETLLELDGSTECLIIFLPERLLEESALADYEIDPAKARLIYAGGFSDPTLAQIGTLMHGLVGRETGPIDQIFADGLRTALAAHLLGNYNPSGWRPAARVPSLDARRLKRVLEFMEARLGQNLTLKDLAREACLSPFHFSRLFHEAIGRSPHQYLIERRIRAAQAMLLNGQSSIAEVALDIGFGSQANFSRAFRKVTGLTPREYREANRRREPRAPGRGMGGHDPVPPIGQG